MANKQFNSVDGYSVGNATVIINETGNVSATSQITRNSRNVPTHVFQANTPPASALVGDQWYNTNNGILFEYLDDGDSIQWVDISSLVGAEVSSITAQTVTANAQPNITSVGTLTTLTVSGNTFLATATGNVGIGTITPSQQLDVAGNIKWSGSTNENVYTIIDGASVDLNPSNGTIQLWTLGANRSPTATSFQSGQSMTLMIDDGAARTITWPSVVWKTDGGTAPTLNTTGFTAIVLWKVGSVLYGARVGDN